MYGAKLRCEDDAESPRWSASWVLRCRDSIALGAGLWSLFLLRKLERLNLFDKPRDEDLSLLGATGGGAN